LQTPSTATSANQRHVVAKREIEAAFRGRRPLQLSDGAVVELSAASRFATISIEFPALQALLERARFGAWW